MRTRRLGRSGPEITLLGLGTWAVGGAYEFGWGPQDDVESIAAIRHAVESGVNWVDTAPAYGIGHSEEVVGRALEPWSAGDDVFVFTKCGRRLSPSGDPLTDLRPESIRTECDRSLDRLGVERIDLYQFHRPDDTGTPVEDSWATMVRLIEEGKVRAAGVSNFKVDLLERCEAVRHVDSLQPPFSVIRRDAAAEVIPWCAEHDTGVIVYSPMQSGILTERFDQARMASLADEDWRRKATYFQEPNLTRGLALRDELRTIARRHGANVSEVAVAWTLAWPGVNGAIVGARSPDQVDGWIGGATLGLTDADLDDIAGAIERTDAGSGPARPPRGRSAADAVLAPRSSSFEQ
jgi:aryl-alcohol dehydrogenase-like predicted oxidoreductase